MHQRVDVAVHDSAPVVGAWVAEPLRTEPGIELLDEFDLDLRLGELHGAGGWSHLLPQGAQSDPAGCLPTGGKGAGGTCNTQDNTCAGTCAGLDSCPHTQCGGTCANTCANTCADTCAATCRITCGGTCNQCNTRQNTCHVRCQRF